MREGGWERTGRGKNDDGILRDSSWRERRERRSERSERESWEIEWRQRKRSEQERQRGIPATYQQAGATDVV